MAADSDVVEIVSPVDGEVTDSFLTAALRWQYPIRSKRVVGGVEYPYFNYPKVVLKVSANPDLSQPIVDVVLRDNQTTYRLVLLPESTYYWQVIPIDEEGERPEHAARARFTTGKLRLDATDDDATRYQNPREGAHWLHEKPVPFANHEPLSPWYDVKSYRAFHLPTFEEVKDKLPVPVYDGHPDVVETYWYCWKTLLHHWYFEPESPSHQAVANICGTKPWGPWGSTMVWDTAFILHFARYGHQAYPFVTAFDNCYARQHEYGFICRESDKDNREVYVWFPVNPPLFAWAEWHYYRISGDKERLARIFLPVVKHYEWWVTYQRRTNGAYWTDTVQEADDSPRNALVHFATSATSYQAFTAACLSQIATEIGRADMRGFFDEEHARLGKLVNELFWDEEHQLYNDLTADGKFITELTPGVFCKHCHMFWPLIAGIATEERAQGLMRELRNHASFYRRNGVPSLSADSDDYQGGPNGAGNYWKGSVWPPIQCMVEEGLKRYGQREQLLDLVDRYLSAMVGVYQSEGTIKEYLAPDRPTGHGAKEFVGWGGIAPVANLIEYVLGFEFDVPNRSVTWQITRPERHGIQNFRLGGFPIDLICAARGSTAESCEIVVSSGGQFDLRIVVGDRIVEKRIGEGESRFCVGDWKGVA